MNTLKKIALCTLLLPPLALMATGSKSFDTTALDAHVGAIKNFLFGTPKDIETSKGSL